MGQAKKEMMRLQDLESQAMGPLLKAGAVEECPVHDGIYIDQFDDDAMKKAYAIGTNMVKNGEVDGTREEFMKAIQSAMGNAGDECGICAKNAED
ncbi:hypothetical protein FJ941_20920 [Mesorhizobium sp. B2-3-13]|uniref:hypothetical protein n=1 Tax=Mesorhizobium sp. B2-3-13 TaxID=2589951 RepID=UPI0011276136|nr:hypothetical protein [Mesorhizobium sp. B2-3-13]TPL79100.1 hypothetical protein FJ941_20920 [Mesorhizobium sp. B2-3-13]